MDEKKSNIDDAVLAEKLMKLSSLIEKGFLKPVQEFLRTANITGKNYEELKKCNGGRGMKSPVGVAASVGDVAIMDHLVDAGFNPDSSVIDGNRPLHLACRAGKIVTVQTLVQKHQVDINAVNGNGFPPLFIAAENGFLDVVKFLVENGANIDYVDGSKQSVLHIATKTSADICEYLLLEGVEVNAENVEGNTALHFAYEGGYKDVARVLVEHGADINYVNEYSNSPFNSVLDNLDFEMFKIMVSEDPECLDSNDSTPLHHAVARSLNVYVRYLVVELGVELGGENEQCETPFSLAMETGNLAIAHLLIRAGLNPAQEVCLQDDDRLEAMLEVDGGAAFIQHVKYLAINPRSLMDITCFRIRTLLGRNPGHASTLPLPQHLKDVVMLTDVF